MFCTLSFFVVAQNPISKNFFNISINAEASTIYSFTQDSLGLMWVGTNKGLFSYDGYSTQQHFVYGENSNTAVYSLLECGGKYIFLGTDNGLLIYNYQTDQYQAIESNTLRNVRTLAKQGSIIWIGSLDGFYSYNLETQQLVNMTRDKGVNLSHHTIYSIITSADNSLYIGTYDGLCRYNTLTNRVDKIVLPSNYKRSNQFINSLLEDTHTNTIWIGTEGALYRYCPTSDMAEEIACFQNNSIKSLTIDGNQNLLLATDNGLYIYNPLDGSYQHVVHDSRNYSSLSNNTIWHLFTDKEKNVWLGTEYGISLSRHNQTMQIIQISQLTGIGDGNRFHAIHKDSRGNYWFGGTNGLILSPSLTSRTDNAIWYKMGDGKNPISHNRIRHIYEDKDRNLWVATDGSINRYDYKSKQFTNYVIVDSTQSLNSNWAYYIFEDTKGKLWIATCLGGIFVVDKEKLLHSSGTYIAEQNYSTSNGLSDNFVNQIVQDCDGNVWVLLYNKGINKINTKTNTIESISIDSDTQPNFIIADKQGYIWAAIRGGIVNIDPKTNSAKTIKLDIFNNDEILALQEIKDNIWISTTEGIWVLNESNNTIKRLNISNKQYTSFYYDTIQENVYMGTVNNVAILSEHVVDEVQMQSEIVLTSLYINGEIFENAPEGASIRYIDNITLNYKQNNLSFEFSELLYAQGEAGQFVYQLEGLDKDWQLMEQKANRISYTNLEYGNYKLLINKLDQYGKPSDSSLSFLLTITPPWYYSLWAKILYFLLGIAIVAWTLNFFRVRNNLRIERIEREKTLELVNLKMDFFTSVSHELKTSLTLIIAPLSKLLLEIKDPWKRKQLERIHQNSLKLNSLTRQLLDFNREEDSYGVNIILSKIDIVEFSKSIFSTYEGSFGNKFSFHFISDSTHIITHIDVLKMESVLNNLISNACKYSDEGAMISLSLQTQPEDNLLTIEIRDTGLGIPANELPYVFEKYYQSSKTKKQKEGTGIGLYIVKKYTEQHGGQVSIESVEDRGTSIRLSLPLIMDQEEDLKTNQPIENEKLHRPTVLIVEDNYEIAHFIEQILSVNYKCIIAYNGKIGFEMAQKEEPDLIISDIMMPVMDGLEMSRLLKKHIPTSTIPIILLTAKDDKKTELDSLDMNIDAFIPKPFDPILLQSKIEQLLVSKQQMTDKLRLENIAAPQAVEAISPDEKLLSVIIQIIEEKITDPDLNVAALSEISGFGSKQVYRKIKQLTGKSPVEYIRYIRIQKAAMLLTQNKFTISEVMYMVGFSNHSYFSKCFQREFEKTPRQFLDDLVN